MISFLVTVCNEHKEIEALLTFLTNHKESEDEIVVLTDEPNITSEVRKVLVEFGSGIKIKRSALNGNFASFKNSGKSICSHPWIFQLDADEMPTDSLLNYLHPILESNEDVDLIHVPRINFVKGITQAHLDKWAWRINTQDKIPHFDYFDVNEEAYKFLKSTGVIETEGEDLERRHVYYYPPAINFPDYQSRIYKNLPKLKWEGKVHETIKGCTNYAFLPANFEYCIIHDKSIARQEYQNNLYSEM